MKKKKKQTKLFMAAFTMIIGIMVISTLLREKVVLLDVLDNAGATILETVDESLVCVFQDGQVVVWDWSPQPQQQGDFKAISAQAIILDAMQMAAVTQTGNKVLRVYSLPEGLPQKDITVGWGDQVVWPRISPDKKTIALIRKNAPDSKDSVLYEFLTLDIEKERLGSPASLSLRDKDEDFVDYALSCTGILYAVGSNDDTGRITAVDLHKGTILWDTVFENTKEFCSVLVSHDNGYVLAGNRDGKLYKLDAKTGVILKKIILLEEGEIRRITNNYSVLNLGFSPNSEFFVATIHPKVYILRSDSDAIVHMFRPADRLVSKIAFSPNNHFVATSDIRAGYPVKIWSMPEEK